MLGLQVVHIEYSLIASLGAAEGKLEAACNRLCICKDIAETKPYDPVQVLVYAAVSPAALACGTVSYAEQADASNSTVYIYLHAAAQRCTNNLEWKLLYHHVQASPLHIRLLADKTQAA